MPSTRLSTRQSSIRSPALKQSSLSFASKRNNANTKGKTDKSAPSTPVTVPASPVSIEITADSSSTDAEDEGTISSRASITGESQYPSKRRRLTEDSDSQTMPVNSKKGKGVFRSREGAENSFGTVVASGDAVERPALDLKDKKGKWRKHFGEVRQKMGNIESSFHTNGQSTVHHILRVFDLSYEYGPCVGVTRLERWERAEALGLDPPSEVKDILLTKEGSEQDEFSQCVFYGEV